MQATWWSSIHTLHCKICATQQPANGWYRKQRASGTWRGATTCVSGSAWAEWPDVLPVGALQAFCWHHKHSWWLGLLTGRANGPTRGWETGWQQRKGTGRTTARRPSTGREDQAAARERSARPPPNAKDEGGRATTGDSIARRPAGAGPGWTDRSTNVRRGLRHPTRLPPSLQWVVPWSRGEHKTKKTPPSPATRPTGGCSAEGKASSETRSPRKI